MTEGCRGGEEEEVKEKEKKEEWTAVLLLDHIRSRNHYIKLLERWTQQLQLNGTLLLGRSILVILQGDRPNIKVTHYISNMAPHKVLQTVLLSCMSCIKYVHAVHILYTGNIVWQYLMNSFIDINECLFTGKHTAYDKRDMYCISLYINTSLLHYCDMKVKLLYVGDKLNDDKID